LAFTRKPGAESKPEFPITHVPGKFANLLQARLTGLRTLRFVVSVGIAFALLDRGLPGKLMEPFFSHSRLAGRFTVGQNAGA
jgi:hypothetical protein